MLLRPATLAAATVAIALSGASVEAKNNKHGNKPAHAGQKHAAQPKAKGHKQGGYRGHATPSHTVAGHCPPGLAKKNPPCVPPGQARNRVYDDDHNHRGDDIVVYRPGDYIRGDYIRIANPVRYDLDPSLHYWQAGNRIYRVDEETGEVLALIGAISALLD